jgi:hypothetical protein
LLNNAHITNLTRLKESVELYIGTILNIIKQVKNALSKVVLILENDQLLIHTS